MLLTKKKGGGIEKKKKMERKELKEKKREKRSCMPAFTGQKENTEENAHWLECKDNIHENGKKDGTCWF